MQSKKYYLSIKAIIKIAQDKMKLQILTTDLDNKVKLLSDKLLAYNKSKKNKTEKNDNNYRRYI